MLSSSGQAAAKLAVIPLSAARPPAVRWPRVRLAGVQAPAAASLGAPQDVASMPRLGRGRGRANVAVAMARRPQDGREEGEPLRTALPRGQAALGVARRSMLSLLGWDAISLWRRQAELR